MTAEQFSFSWDEAPLSSATGLPRATALAARLEELSAQGIYLGTSSWKYPGWLGQIYESSRYQHRGRFARKTFERQCLSEYAAVFPTVSGDFSFYQFPSAQMWKHNFDQLPDQYHFSLKVPEDVTVQRFPDLPRYGVRAGKSNGHFMDADLVRDQLLAPLQPYRHQLGAVIFQFGTFRGGPLSRPPEFIARLDDMLSALPTAQFKFAVEVRNPSFLQDAGYFACLADHGTAHCLNSWTHMPSMAEQIRLPNVMTAPHVVARFLLRPGRTYQQAVEQFSPYQRVQDEYPEGRNALGQLIDRCLTSAHTLFAFVNNRFEGNAIQTIEAVL